MRSKKELVIISKFDNAQIKFITKNINVLKLTLNILKIKYGGNI